MVCCRYFKPELKEQRGEKSSSYAQDKCCVVWFNPKGFTHCLTKGFYKLFASNRVKMYYGLI